MQCYHKKKPINIILMEKICKKMATATIVSFLSTKEYKEFQFLEKNTNKIQLIVLFFRPN